MLPTAISVFFFFSSLPSLIGSVPAFTLPHHQPPSNPEDVVREVHRRVNESITRSRELQSSSPAACQTGNPIDDCWGSCDPNWEKNRQRLADCGIGFGKNAFGGKGGPFYMVTDASDDYDPKNPPQGTLRHGVLTEKAVWIMFQGDMVINLKHELFVSSDTTIDGRGANVQITGAGCITLLSVTNVIIHNLLIYNCKPSPENDIVGVSQSGPEKVSASDGDGIAVQKSRNVWIDHCILANCADGLIDVTQGSSAVTVSNNRFTHHDKVMLLGHENFDKDDIGMQVTVAFNVFGELLGQRMPRCRTGYFHVVNNDYTGWIIYAVGGSGSPTINCQGNRFKAPPDPHALEITKRIDAAQEDWKNWNWRSTDDVLNNGAYFVRSGEQSDSGYEQATSSVNVQPGSQVEQLTLNAGVLGLTSNGLTGGGSGVVNSIPGIHQFNPNTISYEGEGGAQSDQGNNSSRKVIIGVIVVLLLGGVGVAWYFIDRNNKKNNSG